MYYCFQLSTTQYEVHYKAGLQDQWICTCADEDTAKMICDALNDSGEK